MSTRKPGLLASLFIVLTSPFAVAVGIAVAEPVPYADALPSEPHAQTTADLSGICALLATGERPSWPHLPELLIACGLAEPSPAGGIPTSAPPALPSEQLPQLQFAPGTSPRGAILDNPIVNDPSTDSHRDETQNETTVAASESTVCAAWNDIAGDKSCLAGVNDGAACTTTSDCRECVGGPDDGAACLVNSECRTCEGGPNDGSHCLVNEDCRTCSGKLRGGGSCLVNSDCRFCFLGPNSGNDCSTNADCRVCVLGGAAGAGCLTDADCRSCSGGANDGAPCLVNSECPGGGCVRTCVGGANDGNACTVPSECPGGTCTGGSCPRTCNGGANNTNPCTVHSECPGGACTGSTCVRSCMGGANDGEFCTDASECPGGSCNGGCLRTCVAGANDGTECTEDSECPGGSCAGGGCVRTCIGGANDGAQCTEDTECPGGGCSGGGCARTCIGGANDGTDCTLASECPDGNCNGGVCGGQRTGFGRSQNRSLSLGTFDDEGPVFDPAGAPGRSRGDPVLAVDTDENFYLAHQADTDGDDAVDTIFVSVSTDACTTFPNDAAFVASRRRCVGGTNGGGTCSADSGCPGGGTCAPVRVCTCASLVTPTPNAGALCTRDRDCRTCSGGTNANAACDADSECPGGTCTGGLCVTSALDKPWMTVDRSGGPTDGAVYVTWHDLTARRLFLATSSPYAGGLAFGPPIEVAQTAGTARRCAGGPNACATCITSSSCPQSVCVNRAQLLDSQVAVGPDGTVHVSWTDYVGGVVEAPPPYPAPNINHRCGPPPNAGAPPALGPTELVRAIATRPGARDRSCGGICGERVTPGLVARAYNIRNAELSTLAVNPVTGAPYVAWNEGNATRIRYCVTPSSLDPAFNRSCAADADCPSICTAGPNFGTACADASECPGGLCRGPCTRCFGGPNNGSACSNNSECPSTFCAGAAAESDVLFSQRTLSCVGGGNNGAACTAASACPGGACNASWTPPVVVHPPAADQFMPAMTVSPGGIIKIEYYDRADQTTGFIVLSDAVSVDGQTWTNEVVSTTPFTIDGYVPFPSCYMGDYNGIAADRAGFYHVWGDNRESETGAAHIGLFCDGGTNAGGSCIADSECPGGRCASNCVGGANHAAPCRANSECPGGVCGHLDPNVFFDFQPVLRHYLCDEVEREPFDRILGIDLDDQFEPSTVDVIRPKRLCNPADKNGEDPLAVEDPNHLVGYIIKQRIPAPERIEDQTVVDQFGEITVDLTRPDYMMVPTAKDPSGPPSPLVDPRVNHFKCYRTRGAKRKVSAIEVADQFGAFTVDVKRPMRLCVPANKEDEGIPNPRVSLMCYKIRPTRGFPTFRGPDDPVFIDNQFQSAEFEVNHLRELCVPAVLNQVATQCTAD